MAERSGTDRTPKGGAAYKGVVKAGSGKPYVNKTVAAGKLMKTGTKGSAAAVPETASAALRQASRKRKTVVESARLDRLVDRLGSNQLATLMDVSRSQPSRWRSGAEGMGPETRRRLIDLDYVFGRLEQLFTQRQAAIWLTSQNAHLGARPIDVLKVRGAAPVIAAIDAEAEGAFA